MATGVQVEANLEPDPRGPGGVSVGFKRVLAVSLFLAAVLAGLAGLFIYNHARSLAEARFWVTHTHGAIERNLGLFRLVEDAETGERGYLLTEEPAYLEPYGQAVQAIPRVESELAADMAETTLENTGQLYAAMGVVKHQGTGPRREQKRARLSLCRQFDRPQADASRPPAAVRPCLSE